MSAPFRLRPAQSDADRERAALCDHQWRFAGPEPTDGVGCERPGRIVCVECESWFVKPCGSARSGKCSPCAQLHRGDVAAVARSGWSDRPTSRGIWLTLTAPGTESLPWDSSACTHSVTRSCSGAIGCVVESTALAVWHADLPLRWSHFITDVRRLLNPGLTGPVSSWPVRVEFVKTYEPQRRGALHIHAMMRVDGVVTERRVRAALRLARSRHWFGREMRDEFVDLSDTLQAARVAGYTAKYTTKCADALQDVRRLDVRTGELTEGGMRSWSASRGYGESMRSVQCKRRRWWEQQRSSPALGSVHPPADEAPPLDSYCEFYADDVSPGPVQSPP